MKTQLALIIIFYFILEHLVLAVVAFPFPQEIKQPDGTTLFIQIKGDETYNWITTEDNFRILKNKKGIYEYAKSNSNGVIVSSGVKALNKNKRSSIEQELLKTIPTDVGVDDATIASKRAARYLPINSQLKSTSATTQNFPTTGTNKYLLILASFSDTDTSYHSCAFDSIMNYDNYHNIGSFKNYYQEVSYGTLTINTTVTKWVKLDNPRAYYAPESKWAEFAYDAIVKADEAGVDFSAFDNDLNGTVEGIGIVHVGTGKETSSNVEDIWSHSYTLSGGGYTTANRKFDGVFLNEYTTMPELRNISGAMNTIGVFCHEFAHNLGTYDFYDTNDNTSQGTGRWDLMANGTYNGVPAGASPAHPTAWVKEQFGWLSTTTISSPEQITLLPVCNNASAYRINTKTTGEYYLLENRQLIGFDEYLPGHGLIIYHVDENYISTHSASNTINADDAHNGFYPIIANGTTLNSSSTPFPGYAIKNAFTDFTSPASTDWADNLTEKSVTNITEDNQSIIFDFMEIQLGAPINFKASMNGTDAISINWEAPTTGDPVLLAFSTDGVFGTPIDGTTYSANETITGGGTVLSYGTNTNYEHTNLTTQAKFYYKAWTYQSGTYGPSVTSSAFTAITFNFLVKDKELNPLEGANVTINGETKTTASDGTIDFSGLIGSTTKIGFSVTKDSYMEYWDFEIPDENRNIEVQLSQVDFAHVYDLNSSKDFKDISLEWSPIIYDNFDNYDEFSLSNDNWIYEDLDESPTWSITGYEYANKGYTGSFITFNPHNESVKTLSSRWNPYTGKQVAICFSASGTTTNDWMISPSFTVHSGDVLSFMAKSASENYGPERLRVLVSPTGSASTTDFSLISTYPYDEAPTSWTEYSYDLSDYVDQTIRFAINGVSNDAFALLIDKIEVYNAQSQLSPTKETPLINNSTASRITEHESSASETYRGASIMNSTTATSTHSATNGIISYNVYQNDILYTTLNGFSIKSFADVVTDCSEYTYKISPVYNVNTTESPNNSSTTIYSCYTVSFRITDEGNPVENILITLDDVSKYTDSNGEVAFEGFESDIQPLSYTIAPDETTTYTDVLTVNGDLFLNLDLNAITEIKNNPLDQLTIAQNPSTNGEFIVLSGNQIRSAHIEIYNQYGILIAQTDKQTINNQHLINLSKQSSGIYYLKLSYDNFVKTFKLIKL